jgi:PAP2 superfamily
MTLAPVPARRPRLIGEVVIVLILVRGYDYVRSFAATRRGLAQHAGDWLVGVERHLHILVEPTFNHWLNDHTFVQTAAAYWYQFAHLTVTLIVVAWCYWRHPEVYRRARNALVLTNVVGLVVFVVLPVMPPRLLPGGGFFDSVADAGLGSSPGGPVAADQYAAMPSLHLAWATWTAIVGVVLVRERWRWLWVAYPVLTTLVVVATGNHYLLDAVAGTFVALAAASVSGLLRVPGRQSSVVMDASTMMEASDDATTHQDTQDERSGDQRQPHGDQAIGHHGAQRQPGRSPAGDEPAGEGYVEGADPAGRRDEPAQR